jgi:hypothetical protein
MELNVLYICQRSLLHDDRASGQLQNRGTRDEYLMTWSVVQHNRLGIGSLTAIRSIAGTNHVVDHL